MATSQKTFSGDYQINLGPFNSASAGNVGVGEGYLIVNGNLLVQGTSITSNTTILETTAPFILAGEENPGPTNPLGYGNLGLVVQTGGGNVLPTYAAIQFNGNANVWQLSSNTTSGNTGAVGSYANILTEGATLPAGGANTDVQFNNNGTVDGNSRLTFDIATSRLTLDGALVIDHTTNSPSSIAGAATVTSQTPESGGTGIYFTNNSTTDELVSKSKAIVFAIIF